MSDAEKLEPAPAFVWIFQFLKFARLAKVGEFFPELELLEGGEKSAVAVGSASAPGQCPTALVLLRPKWRKSAAQLPAGRLDAKS